MRVLVYLMAGIILTVLFTLFIVDAQAVNARIMLPQTTFTCSKIIAVPGQSFEILIEAPDCKSFAFDGSGSV